MGGPLYTYIVLINVTLVYNRFSLGGPFLLKIGPEFCETVKCFRDVFQHVGSKNIIVLRLVGVLDGLRRAGRPVGKMLFTGNVPDISQNFPEMSRKSPDLFPEMSRKSPERFWKAPRDRPVIFGTCSSRSSRRPPLVVRCPEPLQPIAQRRIRSHRTAESGQALRNIQFTHVRAFQWKFNNCRSCSY